MCEEVCKFKENCYFIYLLITYIKEKKEKKKKPALQHLVKKCTN